MAFLAGLPWDHVYAQEYILGHAGHAGGHLLQHYAWHNAHVGHERCEAEKRGSAAKKQREFAKAVKKQVLMGGTGGQPTQGQKVTVHYTVTLTDGSKVDSSRDRGAPYVFKVGTVKQKGFDEGVATMRAGERARFTCSPDYAYGTAGSPPLIPPNVTVVFDIELLAMKRSWWRL